MKTLKIKKKNNFYLLLFLGLTTSLFLITGSYMQKHGEIINEALSFSECIGDFSNTEKMQAKIVPIVEKHIKTGMSRKKMTAILKQQRSARVYSLSGALGADIEKSVDGLDKIIVNYQISNQENYKCLTHILFGIELLDNKVSKVFNTGAMINALLMLVLEEAILGNEEFTIPSSFIKKYIKDMGETQIFDFFRQQGFPYIYKKKKSDEIVATYSIFNRKKLKECAGNNFIIVVKLKNNKIVDIKAFFKIKRIAPLSFSNDCEYSIRLDNKFKL
jgi:hypothetical protein